MCVANLVLAPTSNSVQIVNVSYLTFTDNFGAALIGAEVSELGLKLIACPLEQSFGADLQPLLNNCGK